MMRRYAQNPRENLCGGAPFSDFRPSSLPKQAQQEMGWSGQSPEAPSKPYGSVQFWVTEMNYVTWASPDSLIGLLLSS